MAKYIDADKLLKEFDVDTSKDVMDISDIVFGVVTSIIERQPTADVVEVVRCRDCKRCFEKRTKRNKQLMRFCMRMDGNEYQVNANDFCSYGERRTDNDL